MNIFVLHHQPGVAAMYMCDKHIPKMIVESCQMLSTAHRVLDGQEYLDKTATGRSVKRWRLQDQEMEEELHHACYVNHPCTVWCRESHANYYWLYEHLKEMFIQYGLRFGADRSHGCSKAFELLHSAPANIPPATEENSKGFAVAMPDTYKIYDFQGQLDAVSSYRNFYVRSKSRFARWARWQGVNGIVPRWYYEGCKTLGIPFLDDSPELDAHMAAGYAKAAEGGK